LDCSAIKEEEEEEEEEEGEGRKEEEEEKKFQLLNLCLGYMSSRRQI
jgi:hypothetical protein